MHSRFEREVAGPAVFYLSEGFGHVGPDWPVGMPDGRLKKEAVVKKSELVSKPEGEVQGIAVSDLFLVFVQVFFEGIQGMERGVNAFPPKPLVGQRRRQNPGMARVIESRRIKRGSPGNADRPGVNGAFELEGNAVAGIDPVAEIELKELWVIGFVEVAQQ